MKRQDVKRQDTRRGDEEHKGMPIPTAVLLGLATFTAAMALLGWALDPMAPTLGAWFVAKATEGGLWSGLFLFLAAVGYFTLRGHGAGKAADKGARETRRGPG